MTGKKIFATLLILSGLAVAQTNNNPVGFANFFYQKGFSEGYKQGYERGYKEGYLQALNDAKVLLEVANKKIKAVRSGCQLLEEKYGSSLAIVVVKKNGKYQLKPFVSDLNLVDNWKDLVEFDIPVVKAVLIERFPQASQRVLSIPQTDREGSLETQPPAKEFIVQLPDSAVKSLKAENVPFVEIKGEKKVVAVFKSENDYKRFCNIYKVCK